MYFGLEVSEGIEGQIGAKESLGVAGTLELNLDNT